VEKPGFVFDQKLKKQKNYPAVTGIGTKPVYVQQKRLAQPC